MDEAGILELYDSSNTLICLIYKDGITINCKDGSSIKINAEVGFVDYGDDGTKIFWANQDEFHMGKSVIETEITISNRLRLIPITTGDSSGMGIVALV